MIQEYELLLSALRQTIFKTREELFIDVDWNLFLHIAQAHMLLPLLYDGLRKNPACWEKVPESAKRQLHGAFLQAIYKDTKLSIMQNLLEQELMAQCIPHIFLKGAILKSDYPIPALRTMCDLDVLVYTQDYPKIDRIAVSMGAIYSESDGNHHNYRFPNGVEVEFHPNLLHQDTPVAAEINPGWQYAIQDAQTGAWELREEGFYLNTICHLAYHFVAGGVGVRFVLDVWVCRNLRKSQPDRVFVEAELQRFGLLEFAHNIESLAEYWFGNGETNELLDELGEYILTSGLHGNSERAMLNAVSLSPGGSCRSALLKKLFYSREEMEGRFPWTKGRPWLQPVAWCLRAFKAVTKHGNLILKWTKGTGSIEQEEILRQKELLARFGIRKDH